MVVTGQRRSDPSQPFPERPEPSTGPVNPDTPSIEDDQNLVDPCDDPATALPWNADAAGARSAGPFLSKAAAMGDTNPQTGLPTLSEREFGRGLARGPNSSVWGNAVSAGLDPDPNDSDPTSKMIIDFAGITLDVYIGDAHSHPNGNELPSEEDWTFFLRNNNLARRNYGRTSETFYMYIWTVDASGQPSKVYVYEDGPRAADSPNPPRPTERGKEVNPDAQPCS
ncbi:MAG: hypothetical protein KL785_08610 [Brevundimonas sp.]|nr:hypothetical protein [Brevundimonas sp.]